MLRCKQHYIDLKFSGTLLFLCLTFLSYADASKPQVDSNSPGEEGDIRLTGSSQHGSGRVEVYHDDQWGAICFDYWDIDDTAVVCRQLGFSAAKEFSSIKGDKNIRKWLDNVHCDGVEAQLIDCPHNGWGSINCNADTDHADVYVECHTGALDGDICLRSPEDNTIAETSGLLHIWNNKEWRKVCGSGWGITESTIVCQQLGLVAAIDYRPTNGTTGQDVKCKGTEEYVDNCTHADWHGNCKDAVKVTCGTSIPDSAEDVLHNPDKYCKKEYEVGKLNINGTATLDIIRKSLGICIGVVPASMKCTKDGGKSYITEDIDLGKDQIPDTLCHRRVGFTCGESMSQLDCSAVKFSIKCPCSQEESFDQVTCRNGAIEYAVGEKMATNNDCKACTCLSNGNFSCDTDYNFCKKEGPPPFEPTCYRTCENPPKPMECDLGDWNVEWFIGGASSFCQSANASCLFDDLEEAYADDSNIRHCPDCIPLDGIPRAVAVVNRKLPGPAVHVCEGDRIIVKVINRMTKEPSMGTTIHWHGMFMQGTQYMDGGFMVTQCPIPIGEAFIYNFKAEPHGTHWWHSHSGLQRGDGMFGALIVRQAQELDVNGKEYDLDLAEHTVVIQDWLHHVGVNGFNREFYSDGKFKARPGSILINGRGGQNITDEQDRPVWCGNNTHPEECPVPKYAEFNVIPNKKYRFRVISTLVARACGIQVSVQNHDLKIIATDGAPTKPYVTKSFVLYSADRIDFVLHANQPVRDYWMHVKGVDDTCKHLKYNYAIIHYNSTEPTKIPEAKMFDGSKTGIKVDPCNSDDKKIAEDFNEDGKFLRQLDSHPNVPAPDWTEPDETFYLELQFADKNLHFLPKINYITFRLPSIPFILQSAFPKERLEICNLENDPINGEERMKMCGEGHCECSHIIRVKQGEVVELFFINHELPVSGFSACHPMHLHGVNFRVVAEQRFDKNTTVNAEFVKELNKNGKINRKPVKDAIAKDTMVAPHNGFTAVQFRADNPGYWYLHCHFEEHLALGMVVVLHVEGKLPERPDNFPMCGGDWPTPRANDGEAYVWSESLLGNLGKSHMSQVIFKAVTEKLQQTKPVLQEKFNRRFEKFEVTNNRLKTDPVTGYHYYLFKINTGNEWFIHVQFRAPTVYNHDDITDIKTGIKISLTACKDSLPDDEILEPMRINAPDNRCKPPVKKVVCSSSSSSGNKNKLDLVFLTSVLSVMGMLYGFIM